MSKQQNFPLVSVLAASPLSRTAVGQCLSPAVPCDSRFPGDLDMDGDVDPDDYAIFHGCITGPDGGPLGPSCQESDLTGDGDNNVADFAAFQRLFTGSLRLPAEAIRRIRS